MASVSEALGVAYEHHRNGRWTEAETLYGRILRAVPDNATALMLLGALLIDTGRLEEAAGRLQQVVAQDSGHVDAHYNLALALGRMGRAEAAQTHYRAVLRIDPHHAPAHNNLGLQRRASGRAEAAVDAFRAAVAAQPGFAEAWFNLGATWGNQGRSAQAAAALERGLAINPRLDAARTHLDRLRRAAERRERIETCLETGAALIRADRTAEGLRALLDASLTAADPTSAPPDPHDPTLLFQAAVALRHDAPEAMRAFCRVNLALFPGDAHANLLMGIALSDSLRFFEAIGPLARAVRILPTDVQANATLGRALFQGGLVEAAIPPLAFAAAQPGAAGDVRDDHLFALLAAPGIGNDELFASAAAGLPPSPALADRAVHVNPRDPDRRLRIGYVSGMIREGSNALLFLEPLLANHDRARFALFLYGDVDYGDPSQRRLVGLVDGARDLRGLDDAEAAARVRADGIDVLVSLLGRGSLMPRNGVFLHKPAPVQVAFHHVMSTATPTMDYWLTDRHATPRGTTERFTERVVRLPRYCQYRPFTHAPDCAPPPVGRNGGVTFGCFTSRWKIGAPVVEAWARILTAVPGARLLLKGDSLEQPAVQAFHRERFAARGIPSDRLRFRGRDHTHEEHMAAYAEVDIALDTFPYSYGNTAFEALWMGVPVVTLAAGRFAGRMGCSILNAAGLAEWVTHTPDAYEACAIGLAADPDALRRLRLGLRERLLRSRLLDGRSYARYLERTYRQIWRRWCADAARQS